MGKYTPITTAMTGTMTSGTQYMWSKSRLIFYCVSLILILYFSYSYVENNHHVDRLQPTKDSLRLRDDNVIKVKTEEKEGNEGHLLSISTKNGFYSSTPYVHEITSLPELHKIREDQTHMMVVFYASWCAHCR